MLSYLGDFLHPHSETIAAVAGTITCIHFLSGIFFIETIRRKGSADEFPAIPLLGGILLTALSVFYGVFLEDSGMIKVNIFGFIVNVVFLIIFHIYTSPANRGRLQKQILATALLIVLGLAYTKYENVDLIEFRLGMVITAILVGLVGSPLLETKHVIRTKNTDRLPFPIITSGSIVSASWLLYGISIKNSILIYQNLFLLFLSCIQLSFFVVYPSKAKTRVQRKPIKKAD